MATPSLITKDDMFALRKIVWMFKEADEFKITVADVEALERIMNALDSFEVEAEKVQAPPA